MTGDLTLLTTSEAADKLGLTAETLRRYIKDGRLVPRNIGTKKVPRYRFTLTDLQNYVDSLKSDPKGE